MMYYRCTVMTQTLTEFYSCHVISVKSFSGWNKPGSFHSKEFHWFSFNGHFQHHQCKKKKNTVTIDELYKQTLNSLQKYITCERGWTHAVGLATARLTDTAARLFIQAAICTCKNRTTQSWKGLVFSFYHVSGGQVNWVMHLFPLQLIRAVFVDSILKRSFHTRACTFQYRSWRAMTTQVKLGHDQ